jgi:phage terminase small subunit
MPTPARKKRTPEILAKPAFEQLKAEHQHFVKEYVRNFGKAYKAYMVAYPKAKATTAATEANRLLNNPKILEAIEDEYKKIWKEKDTEIEKSKTYQMIHVLGNSDISDVVDLEGGTLTVKDLKEIPIEARQCIQSIEYIKKETQHGIDENIKVRLHPKIPALEMRAKIQKLIDKDQPQQLEITIVPAKRPEKKESEEK